MSPLNLCAGCGEGGVLLSGWMALKSEYPGAITEQGKTIPFLHCHGDADRVVQYAWGKKRCVPASQLPLPCLL